MIDLLMFLLGDAVAMYSGDEYDEALADAISKDVRRAYEVNCTSKFDVNVH